MSRLEIVLAVCILGIAGYFALPHSAQAVVATVLPEVYPVQEWEHGFKTSRVVATRMHSEMMGWNAKLDFPENAYDSDTMDVSDYIEQHGCGILESGGSPGAPAYIRCDGVDSKEKMSAKLRDLLPGLSRVMFALSSGLPTGVKHIKYEWPDTSALDKSKPCWARNNNMRGESQYGVYEGNANPYAGQDGKPYHKAEVAPGHWQWVAGVEPLSEYDDPRCEWAGGWATSGGFSGTEYSLRRDETRRDAYRDGS
jgi:hypothetical protein